MGQIMSRFPLVLFWVAGLIALAASVEYQCLVNQFVGSHSTQKAAHKNHEESGAKNQIVAQSSAFDNTASDNKGTNAQQNTGNDFERRTTDAEESMALATWVGSIATVLAFAGLIYTLLLTRKQTKALLDSNAILKKTHNAERRPWVSVDIGLEDVVFKQKKNAVGESGMALVVICNAKNTGVTPAMDVVFFADIASIVPNPDAVTRLIKEKGDIWRGRKESAGEAIFPDAPPRKFGSEVFITESEIERIERGNLAALTHVLIFGFVQYRTVSGDIKQTAFAHYLGNKMSAKNEVRHLTVADRHLLWTKGQVRLIAPGYITAD